MQIAHCTLHTLNTRFVAVLVASIEHILFADISDDITPLSRPIPFTAPIPCILGYEYWKKYFVTIAGDQETAVKYRTAIYLGSATVAE